MKGLVTVLTQAWEYWQSDSRAESVIAVAMAALAGVLLFAPRLKTLVSQVL